MRCEIARDLGYENSNVITMFKRGTTRVPLEKVVPLALAVGEGPGMLLRHWFEAYMPEALPDITSSLCCPGSTDRGGA